MSRSHPILKTPGDFPSVSVLQLHEYCETDITRERYEQFFLNDKATRGAKDVWLHFAPDLYLLPMRFRRRDLWRDLINPLLSGAEVPGCIT